MALKPRLMQTYFLIYQKAQTVDVMMLVHNQISPYAMLILSRIPHTMAV